MPEPTRSNSSSWPSSPNLMGALERPFYAPAIKSSMTSSQQISEPTPTAATATTTAASASRRIQRCPKPVAGVSVSNAVVSMAARRSPLMLAVVNAIDVQMEALAVPAGVCHSMARAGSRRPRSPLSPQLIPMGMRFSKGRARRRADARRPQASRPLFRFAPTSKAAEGHLDFRCVWPSPSEEFATCD